MNIETKYWKNSESDIIYRASVDKKFMYQLFSKCLNEIINNKKVVKMILKDFNKGKLMTLSDLTDKFFPKENLKIFILSLEKEYLQYID